MLGLMVDSYPEVDFGGFSRVDGTVAFYARVHALLEAHFRVLDIGCGRGQAAQDPVAYRRRLATLQGRCAHVLGIDLSPAGGDNPLLDEFRLMTDPSRWPVADASIDLGISDHVLEHVSDSRRFFSECARAIRPGGYLCIRTPNAYGYVSVVSRITPNRLHARILRVSQKDRCIADIFPTFYRCNTARRLKRVLAEAGFRGCVLTHESEPNYLAFSRLAYRLGVFVHRHLPDPLKSTLLAFARREPS